MDAPTPVSKDILAIILAAGQSTRMGQPKMLMPWGSKTILGKVIDELHLAGIRYVRVVTGADRDAVAEIAIEHGAETVYNPAFSQSEMLASLQHGLKMANISICAALVVLGDQPQIESRVIRKICERYSQTGMNLVIPSYEMRRGHPWLIARSLWQAIGELDSRKTMRDFLDVYKDDIEYVNVDTTSILKDVDTPNDYAAYKPKDA